MVVDHINHNTLDNRRFNLRICTKGQNNMNRKPYIGKSSQYKGVIWAKHIKKWTSKIEKDTIVHHLGTFDREEDAARAYNKKAKELFKEFAYLNEIRDDNGK